MAKTFYDIFEVDASATPDEIRAAYKRMVQRHHPDKHRGQASSEELLKALNYAYNILSDPRKRASYDAKLSVSAHAANSNVYTEVDAEVGAGSAYVYTGEATINSAASGRVPEATTRKPETHSSGLSHLSRINSWLALGMLFLLFMAVSRFFYQATEYKLLNMSELGSMTLFYGVMMGIIVAGGAVWLTGKMVARTVPLVWPMNLIFRERVRSDLHPEHRKVVSAALVTGILLTFAVPDLDQPVELTLDSTASFNVAAEAAEAPVAEQNSRKNTTVLPDTESVRDASSAPSPVILAQNLQPDVLMQQNNPPASAAKAPFAPIISEALPESTRLTAPLPAPPPTAEQKIVNTPVAVIPPPVSVKPVKPVKPEKPIAKKAPVEKKVAALVTPQPAARPTKVASPVVAAKPAAVVSAVTTLPVSDAIEKKGSPTVQNDIPLAETGGPTVAKYRKGAEQGAANAQYQLGRAYEKGEGASRDYKQAITWYRKAADQGYGLAQHSLGSMYMLGKGVSMDPVAAYVWLSIAANNSGKNNSASGQQAMDYLVDTLTPAQLADAKRKVAKWSPQRAR